MFSDRVVTSVRYNFNTAGLTEFRIEEGVPWVPINEPWEPSTKG